MTLDDLSLAADGFVPDLVKLDVEGWELEALRGGQRLLSERKPHLVVETYSEQLVRGCVELLAAHGYVPRVVAPRRWLPEVREGHNRWLVAEGVPFHGAGTPLGTGPNQIGTQPAQKGTEPSHLGADKVDTVEHEGGGRFPALYGWGVRGPAAGDMFR